MIKLSLLFLLALTLQAAEFEAEVIGVMDGDTIKVLTSDKKEIKIRFEHIDAPEKKQPFGQVCKQALYWKSFFQNTGQGIQTTEETTRTYLKRSI